MTTLDDLTPEQVDAELARIQRTDSERVPLGLDPALTFHQMAELGRIRMHWPDAYVTDRSLHDGSVNVLVGQRSVVVPERACGPKRVGAFTARTDYKAVTADPDEQASTWLA